MSTWIDTTSPLVKAICEARVQRIGTANRRPWWHEAELVQAILQDIERAGYVLVRHEKRKGRAARQIAEADEPPCLSTALLDAWRDEEASDEVYCEASEAVESLAGKWTWDLDGLVRADAARLAREAAESLEAAYV